MHVNRIVSEHTAVKISAETCLSAELFAPAVKAKRQAGIFSLPMSLIMNLMCGDLCGNMGSVSACRSVVMKMCLVSYISWKLNVPSQVCER